MRRNVSGLKRVMGLVVATGLAMAGRAAEEAAPVAVNADLPVASAYVWRGQVLNDEAVCQPALNLTKGGLGVNVWGNFNLTDSVTDDPDFSEIDLTVSYGAKIGPVGYGFGLIEYLFPNSTLATEEGGEAYPGTRELYASLSLPDLPVVPSVSVYRDIDEAEGTYTSVAVGYSKALAKVLTLGLSASLGAADADYNSFYFGVDEAALNDANVGATLSWALRDGVTVTPGVQYTWLPDSEIETGAEGLYKDKEQLAGSLKVNVVF